MPYAGHGKRQPRIETTRRERAKRVGARAHQVITAAAALVDRLDQVHAHPSWVAVWTMARFYDGPTYTDELRALRAALGRRADL